MFENHNKQLFLTSPNSSVFQSNLITNPINDIKYQISTIVANYPNQSLVKNTAKNLGLPYHLFTENLINQYLSQNLPLNFYQNLLHYVKRLQTEFNKKNSVTNSCQKARSSHNYRIRSEKKNIQPFLLQREIQQQIQYKQFMTKFYGKEYQNKAEAQKAKKAEKAKKFNQKAMEKWQQLKNIEKDKIESFRANFIKTCMETKPKFHKQLHKASYGSLLDQLNQSPQLSPIKPTESQNVNLVSSRNIKTNKQIVNSCHTIQLNNLLSPPNKSPQNIANKFKLLNKQINNTVHLTSTRQKKYKQKRQMLEQLQDKQNIQKMIQKLQKIQKRDTQVKLKRKAPKCHKESISELNIKDNENDKMILTNLQKVMHRKEKILMQRTLKIKKNLQIKERKRQNYHSQYIKKIQKQNQMSQQSVLKKNCHNIHNFFRQANIRQRFQAQQRIEQFNQLSLKLRKIPSNQLKKRLKEIKCTQQN